MKQALLAIAARAIGTVLGWGVALVVAALIEPQIGQSLCAFIRSLIR